MVITNEFLDNCITAANSNGEEDEEFTKISPQGISDDEKGRALLKGYLAIEWHLAPQLAFSYSKLTIETPEQGVKYVQS